MAHPISTAAPKIIAKAMQSQNPLAVPLLAFQCVSRTGEILANVNAGRANIADLDSRPIDDDSVFWIASGTKIITATAFMQLVERGLTRLDDPDQVDEVLPELRRLKVLEGFDESGKPILMEQKRRITLRMLITHRVRPWKYIGQDVTKDENHMGNIEGYKQPLVDQPGENFIYSTAIDSIGMFIERVSDMKLGTYCEQNIFIPLGLKNISFTPNNGMLSRLVSMHARDKNGAIHPRKHLMRAAFGGDMGPDHQHSGGGGVFCTQSDFCQFLATLINNGTSPRTGAQILSPSTVDLMFTSQIPDFYSKFGSRMIFQSANLEMSTPAPVPTPPPPPPPLNFGLGFLLEGPTLQRGNAPGLANTFWSFDREKGVAATICSQVLPFGDELVGRTWRELLDVVYE